MYCFKPAILEKELCYSLNVNDIKRSKGNPTINEENALILLLDYNIERSKQVEETEYNSNATTSSKLQILEENDGNKDNGLRKAKVHLSNIQEFYHLGGKKYQMSSVKVMQSTSAFEKFDNTIKKCQNKYSRIECANNKLMTHLLTRCGCVPFHLITAEQFYQVCV